MPGILADQDCRPAPPGIKCLHTSARFHKALFVEDPVCWQEDFSMDVPNTGTRTSQGGIQARVIESVAVDLIDAERDIQRRNASLLVLPAQIVKQLLSRQREVPNPPFQEVAGQSGFGRNNQLRRLRPAAHLPKKRSHPAEVLLVSPFLG